MKKIQLLTFASLSLITILGYVYIFGDSGYIIQSRLKKNLVTMEMQVKELERENELLNQKVLAVSSNEISSNDETEQSSIHTGKSIILKFENNLEEVSDDSIKSEMDVNLFELRSLYIVTMLFISLVAVTLSVYLSDNKKYAGKIKEQH